MASGLTVEDLSQRDHELLAFAVYLRENGCDVPDQPDEPENSRISVAAAPQDVLWVSVNLPRVDPGPRGLSLRCLMSGSSVQR